MRYLAKEPIHYGTNAEDQRRYEPGEAIDLDEESAKALLKADAIELPKKGKPAPEEK